MNKVKRSRKKSLRRSKLQVRRAVKRKAEEVHPFWKENLPNEEIDADSAINAINQPPNNIPCSTSNVSSVEDHAPQITDSEITESQIIEELKRKHKPQLHNLPVVPATPNKSTAFETDVTVNELSHTGKTLEHSPLVSNVDYFFVERINEPPLSIPLNEEGDTIVSKHFNKLIEEYLSKKFSVVFLREKYRWIERYAMLRRSSNGNYKLASKCGAHAPSFEEMINQKPEADEELHQVDLPSMPDVARENRQENEINSDVSGQNESTEIVQAEKAMANDLPSTSSLPKDDGAAPAKSSLISCDHNKDRKRARNGGNNSEMPHKRCCMRSSDDHKHSHGGYKHGCCNHSNTGHMSTSSNYRSCSHNHRSFFSQRMHSCQNYPWDSSSSDYSASESSNDDYYSYSDCSYDDDYDGFSDGTPDYDEY